MKLEGIHHITAITEDGQRNVDFYVGVMGLRLVKKTVNQDHPTVYHLFYADEKGSAGLRPDLLRVPRRPARAGGRRDGPPDRLAGRARTDSLDFWAERLERPRDRGRARRRSACASPTPRASSTSWRSSRSTTSR